MKNKNIWASHLARKIAKTQQKFQEISQEI
jgi:hypothetical protein